MVRDPRLDEAQAKSRVLVEALPYIRLWSGKVVVVKIGGESFEEQSHLESLATDVVLLRQVGIKAIIVHGGGPQISEAMRRRGSEPTFVNGRRVTDAATMEIVKSVLLDEVNKQIVAAIELAGGKAAGVSGDEDGLIAARPVKGPEGEDLGFVGEVEGVSSSPLVNLIASEAIPVVAPIGSGPDGSYNINADLAAGALAVALNAAKIVFLTNVPGLYLDLGDEGSLISNLTVERCERMLAGGNLSAGMVPKIQSVVAALKGGVPQAHILDGRVQHALLLEIFTDEGVGTMVLSGGLGGSSYLNDRESVAQELRTPKNE